MIILLVLVVVKFQQKMAIHIFFVERENSRLMINVWREKDREGKKGS